MKAVFKILATALTLQVLAISAVSAQQALVSTDAVVRQDFTQTVPILGRLVAKQSGTVAARIPGAVVNMLVQVGDRVKLGQPITIIDSEALKLQKKLAENQRAEAQTRIATAKAQLALAGQEVKRLSSLKSSASVSKAALDDANQQKNIAFARVREAEANLNSSEASIRLADLDIRNANVNAPYNGTVTAKLTEVGSYLQRGQAVVQLVSDKLLEVEADIPATRLSGLASGTMISMRLDDGSNYTAEVRAIVPEENPRTRTRRVRFNLDIDQTILALAVEQSVTLDIPAGASREVLSVHKDGIIRQGGGSIVYVVEQDVAKLRPIQTGASVGNRVEVLNGLVDGDQVVVRGNERLRPDQGVSATPIES